MIFELLTWSFSPSVFASFLREDAGAAHDLLRRSLPVIGAFTAASGRRNQLFWLAAYEDYGHREEAQAQLDADPDLAAFLAGAGAAIVDEETTILNPTPFSALRQPVDIDAAIARGATRDTAMLFELRTYTALPGHMPAVLRTLVEEGNPITHEFVEWPVGYFTAETGLANRVMMFWAYSSTVTRAERKSRMLPDPRFQELGSRFNLHFSEQRSDFLTPLGFSALR